MRKSGLLLFILIGINFYLNGQSFEVKSFKIEGNTRLKTEFISSIINLKQGASLDSNTIENDMQLLRQMPSIFHSSYFVDSAFNVTYHIHECHTLIPLVNFYTTNFGEFAYRIGIIEYNLFGRNMEARAFYQRDIYNSIGLRLRAPQFFSKNWGFATEAQTLTTLEPVFLDNNKPMIGGNTESLYKYNIQFIEALGMYQFNFKTQLSLGLNVAKETYEYREGATQKGVPIQVETNRIIPKLLFTYNDTKIEYQYISGFRSDLNVQYANSENPFLPDFFIGRNDFFYYKRVGKKGNWANRIRLGMATNSSSPFAPFAADNNINVRGVGNTIDRGTAVMVLNSEYRQIILEKKRVSLQANVFLDAGTWRQPGGSFEEVHQRENLKIYPGIGFRLMNTRVFNAVFRVDYGWGLLPNSSQGFVFGIGQYF